MQNKKRKRKTKRKEEIKMAWFSHSKLISICHSGFDGDTRCQLRHYCSGVGKITTELMDTLFSWIETQSKQKAN